MYLSFQYVFLNIFGLFIFTKFQEKIIRFELISLKKLYSQLITINSRDHFDYKKKNYIKFILWKK